MKRRRTGKSKTEGPSTEPEESCKIISMPGTERNSFQSPVPDATILAEMKHENELLLRMVEQHLEQKSEKE